VRKLILVGAALVPLWSAPLTRGVVIFSDSFNYVDGPLVSVSGGTWVHHSGTTTGEVKVVSGRVFLTQTNGEDVSAQLQGQPYPPTTNILLYASFIVNFRSLPSSSGGYFAHFKAANATTFADKIYATTNGVPAGFFHLGVANSSNSPSVLINSDLSLNTDYLVVARFALSNASSTLWLNPTTESDPGVTATDTATTITVTTFALRESLSSGDGMGSLFFDNLIIGTNFTDVVVPATGPPLVTSQPQSQTVVEGTNVILKVTATGAPPLSYQWLFYGTNIDGATNASLMLLAVTTNQTGPYQAVITNSAGMTNSDIANLTVNPNYFPPFISAEPQDQIVTEGANVSFNVAATGTAPLAYQWHFNGTDVANATNSTFTLTSVTTNQSGAYSVTITNIAGSTNSEATLSVNPASLPAFSYLTYNMKGNFATNWTTNAPQIQAIGHEVMYLNPDVITFNEVPNQYTYEMTNFVAAFLPGYHLAVNSATDGFIRSAVVSRFPIAFSKSYLHSADLSIYGYTNADFTRDLFQAQIVVPAFPQPLNVFVVHLKSGQDTDSSSRRGAETSAISNFLATVFLATNSTQPYVLSGDMNEDINNPPPSHPQSIQRLVNSATGLQLTTPLNPFSGSALTFSIQSSNGLSHRYDYIMPCPLLFSNINSSQVFRTDLLPNPPAPLLGTDDVTGSDHLPVFMVFANPYSKPFRLTSVTRSNAALALSWQSVLGQPYRLEASSNLTDWTVLATSLMATGANFSFSTNTSVDSQFFRVYRVP